MMWLDLKVIQSIFRLPANKPLRFSEGEWRIAVWPYLHDMQGSNQAGWCNFIIQINFRMQADRFIFLPDIYVRDKRKAM
jgi:hypothetical protein